MSKDSDKLIEPRSKNSIKDLSSKLEKNKKFMMEESQKFDAEKGAVAMVSSTQVQIMGSKIKIESLANVTFNNRSFSIKPWDPQNTDTIVKALRENQVRFNPQIDDKGVIRINLPALSVERRKELSLAVKSLGEQCKKAVRNFRRSARDDVDKDLNDKLISKENKWAFVKEIDNMSNVAEEEIEKITIRMVTRVMEE